MANPMFKDARPRDWAEDFTHENGQYMCGCVYCSETFIGHKRRVVCKVCATLCAAAHAAGRAEGFTEAIKFVDSVSHLHDDAPTKHWANSVIKGLRAIADAPTAKEADRG